MATLKGIWVFNDSLDIYTMGDNGNSYTVDFSSNGNTYTQIKFSHSAGKYYMYYGSTKVYQDVAAEVTWTATAYKTIEITSEPTDEAFITWLTANATQQATEETSGVTVEYNGSVVATVEGGNTATLPVKDLKMKSDIVITVPKAESGTDSAIPIEVSTEDEMTALLTSGEVGGVYKYTGTTGTYENGALYVLEAELGSFTYAQTSSWYSQFIVRQFLIGMTWAEFIASKYNAIQADKNEAGTFGVKGQFINQNGYVMFSGTDLNSANPLTIPVFNNNYSSVAITDVIYGGTYMSVQNSGGGSGN